MPVQGSLLIIGLLTAWAAGLNIWGGQRWAMWRCWHRWRPGHAGAHDLAGQGASVDLVGMLAASLRMSTPIALGALAGILCERSGVVNIAIEGMMLSAAAFGFAANLYVACGQTSGWACWWPSWWAA